MRNHEAPDPDLLTIEDIISLLMLLAEEGSDSIDVKVDLNELYEQRERKPGLGGVQA